MLDALQRAHTALDDATMETNDDDIIMELTIMMRRLRELMKPIKKEHNPE